MTIEQLAGTLPSIDGDKAPWFMRKDENVLRISGEHDHSYKFLDYYGEYRGGYAWIHPELEAWAKDNGGFFEWENPSNIAFYLN